MGKSFELFRGYLATQLNYIPAMCVVFAFYFGILKKEPTMWKYIVLSVLPFVFYLIRYFIKNMPGFFACHLVIVVLPYFLAGNLVEKIIFVLMSLIFCGVSIYFKLTRPFPEDGVLYVAMTCILAFVSYIFSVSGMGANVARAIAVLAILYVVIFLIYEYITGYINYIKNNEVSNQSIPKEHIFKTSISALAGFVMLFVGFAALLANKKAMTGWIDKIGEWIERFLKWLFSFAPEAMEQGRGESAQNVQDPYKLVEVLEREKQIPPEVNEMIGNIVTIGAYIISIVVVLLFAYAIFRAIVAAFKVKREDNEEEVVLVREKVTKVRQKNTENKVSERQFSKEKKIRKMYEDLVFRKNLGPKPDKAEKQLVTNRLKHQTPKEQCRYLNSGEVIRRMYEKARYSGEEVSKDDVKAMKEICTLESKSR